MKIRATVVFDLDEQEINPSEQQETYLCQLLGELVKVKSGRYDNILMGTIESIQELEETN